MIIDALRSIIEGLGKSIKHPGLGTIRRREREARDRKEWDARLANLPTTRLSRQQLRRRAFVVGKAKRRAEVREARKKNLAAIRAGLSGAAS